MGNEQIYRLTPRMVAVNLRKQYLLDNNKEVNIFQLVEKMNIKYIEANIGEGILGACKSIGLKRLIVVDPNIEYLPQKRFTIAHEIGHLLMHQGNHRCVVSMFDEGKTKSGIESEANEFASEFLMPQNILKNYLKTQDITLDLIKKISDNYNTSFSPVAISLLRDSDDEVAVFFHDGEKIEWSMKTNEMRYEIENAYRGSQVTNKAISTKGRAEGKVDAEIWIRNPDEDIKCIEETIFFPKIKKLLTIVRIESIF